jgi:hypothetical protein
MVWGLYEIAVLHVTAFAFVYMPLSAKALSARMAGGAEYP